MKTCLHCQQQKHHTEYYTRPNGKLHSWCKQCTIKRTNIKTRVLRYAVGERQGSSKLTAENVKQMRKLREYNGWSDTRLAKQFGISRQYANAIVNGIYWKHL